ncbi:MAG: OmpA family protein [Deltaproteobacteria bacterium]|nr:OmpA family protein [Deltaproteobacteria bacterium]
MTVALFLSLMILLLAFFIVLVSMSTIEEKKKEEVLSSIHSTFGPMPSGRSPFYTVGGIASKSSAPMTPLEADYRQIRKLAYSEIGQDKVRLMADTGRRVIILRSQILFDPEGVNLKAEAVPFLKGLAAIIERSSYLVEVNGYTDDIDPAPGGPARNNWGLSGLRALAVVKFLQANGVALERLAAYGYGPLNPLKPNTTAANRILNHRVELVLDETLVSDVDELRVLKAPGRLRFRGFIFDLFGRPAEEAP